jgi:HAMP domain-containing protein
VGWQVAGGVLQILGFVLVAIELGRVQRREFGEPVWMTRLRGRIRRLLRQTKTVHLGSATATASANMSARAKIRTRPGQSVEDRVSALEKNFGRLDEEVDEERIAATQAYDLVLEQLTVTRAEVNQRRELDERTRKAFLRTSVLLQAWGTAFFVIGTILGIVGVLS